MRQIVWSNDALQDFKAAISYIAKDNPFAASLVVDRIDAAIVMWAEVPVGHQGRVKGIYEKLVLKTPFIIAYAMTDQTITILRVIPASRHWQDETWPLD